LYHGLFFSLELLASIYVVFKFATPGFFKNTIKNVRIYKN